MLISDASLHYTQEMEKMSSDAEHIFFSSLLLWSCPVNTAAMPSDLQQNGIENFIYVSEP